MATLNRRQPWVAGCAPLSSAHPHSSLVNPIHKLFQKDFLVSKLNESYHLHWIPLAREEVGFSRWKMGFRRDFRGFDLFTMQHGNARSRIIALELLFTFQYSTTYVLLYRHALRWRAPFQFHFARM